MCIKLMINAIEDFEEDYYSLGKVDKSDFDRLKKIAIKSSVSPKCKAILHEIIEALDGFQEDYYHLAILDFKHLKSAIRNLSQKKNTKSSSIQIPQQNV